MTDLKYKNYIFDFYGTLVDIETDEKDRWLWQQVLAIYASYGADYSPRSLSQKYLDLVAQEEQRLKKETAYEHVEIDLVPVFIRLLTEAEQTHATENKIDDLLTWGNFMASTFRVLSRKHLAAYENTLATLKVIKDKGGHVFILSNAQRAFTQAEIEETGCIQFVDKIYMSSDYGMKKPQLDFLQLLLDEQGIDVKESVMIGNDFSTDIAIAEQAGMDAIFLNSFAYNQEKITQLNRMGARVIDNIAQVLEI